MTTHLLFLIRRDPTVAITAHLVAGILALVVATGAPRSEQRATAQVVTATALVQR